jgi:hypothetical protein
MNDWMHEILNPGGAVAGPVCSQRAAACNTSFSTPSIGTVTSTTAPGRRCGPGAVPLASVLSASCAGRVPLPPPLPVAGQLAQRPLRARPGATRLCLSGSGRVGLTVVSSESTDTGPACRAPPT